MVVYHSRILMCNNSCVHLQLFRRQEGGKKKSLFLKSLKVWCQSCLQTPWQPLYYWTLPSLISSISVSKCAGKRAHALSCASDTSRRDLPILVFMKGWLHAILPRSRLCVWSVCSSVWFLGSKLEYKESPFSLVVLPDCGHGVVC